MCLGIGTTEPLIAFALGYHLEQIQEDFFFFLPPGKKKGRKSL